MPQGYTLQNRTENLSYLITQALKHIDNTSYARPISRTPQWPECVATELTITLSNILERSLEQSGWTIMAKKRTPPQWSTEFVDAKLNSEQADAFQAWVATNAKNPFAVIADYIGQGYKLAVRWDDHNECFIVSSVPVDDDNPNKGLCLTSRSDDMVEALLLNTFKHEVLFSGKKWSAGKSKDNWG